MKITIEGPTGAGKSILGTLLCQLLRRHGYTVSFKHEILDQEFPINWDATRGPLTTQTRLQIVEVSSPEGQSRE